MQCPGAVVIPAADLPISSEYTIATFADDNAVLATHRYPDIAAQKLESNIAVIQNLFKSKE
jgi:hypothetical protein